MRLAKVNARPKIWQAHGSAQPLIDKIAPGPLDRTRAYAEPQRIDVKLFVHQITRKLDKVILINYFPALQPQKLDVRDCESILRCYHASPPPSPPNHQPGDDHRIFKFSDIESLSCMLCYIAPVSVRNRSRSTSG